MIPTTTHVLPLTTVRRERHLPLPGFVTVDEGVHVEANTVIAKTAGHGRHYIYDLVRRLGVTLEEVNQYVKAKAETDVEKGKVLAAKPGLLGTIDIRAPARGRVVAVEGGRMLFESVGAPLELRAGFAGQVSSIIPEYGVMLETTASLVQGMWGSGRQNYGTLRMVSDDRTTLISPAQIDASCVGQIVIGGLANEAVLKSAAKVKVGGLVVGSMPAALVSATRSLPFPILLTEGFGAHPMAEPTWTLLIGQNGRDAALDARPADRWSGRRPELIVPLPTPYTPPPPPLDGQALAEGRKVRLLRAPYAGSIGIIRTLPTHLQVFASGLQTTGALVEVDGAQVLVPQDNLEVFE